MYVRFRRTLSALEEQFNSEFSFFLNIFRHFFAFKNFIRLLYEEVEGNPVECTVTLDDDFIIETTYPKIKDHKMTAYLISVASLVGFKADRRGDTLVFRAKITPSHLLKVYATSTDEIMDWLVLTYRM